MSKDIDSQLVKELQSKLNTWIQLSTVWAKTYWIVGILGLTMSALAATEFFIEVRIEKKIEKYRLAPYFSVVATICFGILGFANPQRRTARYIRSYRILETAKLEYLHGSLSIVGLLEKYREAEFLLNENDLLESKSSSTMSNNIDTSNTIQEKGTS